MSGSGQQLRTLASDQILFYGYRWLAWVVAGVALVLPGNRTADLPREAGLLVLGLIVNLLVMAIAANYSRVARQRPPILALDIFGSMAFVWATRSELLPFFPLALASLIVPAMVGGWRGACAGALLFVALDMLGLAWLNADASSPLALLVVALRVSAPFAFGLAAYGLLGFMHQRHSARVTTAQALPVPARGERQRDAQPAVSSYPQLNDPTIPRAPATTPFELPHPARFAGARLAPERGVDAAPRTLHALPPGLDGSLPEALGQLVAQTTHATGNEIRLRIIGTALPLQLAQHQVLLRLAHEGLLNVQQHAHAQLTLVNLQYEPRAISLVIQDDGVGLLDGTHERPGVHALRALHYRLSELEGQLEVFEAETGGVTLRAILPLDDRPA